MDALTLADMAPTAVGIALSPLPIAAVIMMLLTSRARANGAAFVFGWIAGLLLVGAAILLFGGGSLGSATEPSTAALVLKAVLGIALLAMSARVWRTRPSSGGEPEPPKWMAQVESFSPMKAFGLAALLSGANPKNLALNASAAVAISQAGFSGNEKWLALVVFAAASSLTVAVPVAAYFVLGDSAERSLRVVKSWLITENATIMGVILLIFGARLATEGIAGLLG